MNKRIAFLATAAALPLALGWPSRALTIGEPQVAIHLPSLLDGPKSRYIVLFKDGVTAKPNAERGLQTALELATRLVGLKRGEMLHVYEHALAGFAARMTPEAAQELAADPRVAVVEEDQPVRQDATQASAPWDLDRIDQRRRPLDAVFTYGFKGAGVHAYVVDSGIRATHAEFKGRVGNGKNFVDDGRSHDSDCSGHGTHVAGTIGGTKYGVAKAVTLHALRVLDCDGSGFSSDTAAAVDWVTANHVKPAVANLSIASTSTAVATAVKRAIAAGVVFSVSAGNDNLGTCDDTRVSNKVKEALTVGAVTSADARSSFSNYGSCVDLFAPGSLIVSAGNSGDTSTASKSGTSMATPHVTGVAALYLEQFGNQSPQAVHEAIVNRATSGELTGLGAGSPNRLLHSLFPAPEVPTTVPPATVPPTTVPPAASPSVVFFDDFETDRGWIIDPSRSDTATSGRWERSDPESTDSSGPKQLGSTVSGNKDLVTGALAGSASSDHDVDGGVTSIRSPTVKLPPSGTITLSLSFYLAHGANSSSSDYLRVFIVNTATGASERVFNGLGATENDNAVWTSREFNLKSYAGKAIHILIQAADGSGASMVEAAFDDVLIRHQA
ncbi:MAG: S8 family peptidase [Acidimicrobiia bacterium]